MGKSYSGPRVTAMCIAAVCAIVFTLTADLRAESDYSDKKGDFRIFDIGDSREKVRDKIGYLVSLGQITAVSEDDGFSCETLGETTGCRFIFKKNIWGTDKLHKIVISFNDHTLRQGPYDLSDDGFVKYLESMLARTYGGFRRLSPYLFMSQLPNREDTCIFRAVAGSKTVDIAAYRDDRTVTIRIIISSWTDAIFADDPPRDFN